MEAFLKNFQPSSSGIKAEKSKPERSETQKKRSIPTPWVEKYRPKSVDEVVQQDEVVAVLKKCLLGADLPNLLFYGPPGTGKTSTILALAREIFGDLYKTRTLELNASDERGIQVIREKVKTFSQQTASSVRPDGRKCPPYKIVILDEADSMTGAAQAALRRTMEKETKSTRFCLICNYVSRIIEPITSRCSKFRFKPLSTDVVVSRLRKIADEENVTCDDKVLDAIVETSGGDMRKAITVLQSAHRLKGEEGIDLSDIDDIAGMVPVKWIDRLIEVCGSDSYERLETYLTDLMYEGYTAVQFINQLNDSIVFSSDFDDQQKSIICDKIAVADKNLLDGADEFLQLMNISCTIMHQICHSSS